MVQVHMNQIVLFNNRTAGRDKLARLVQYASKLIWHLLRKWKADPKLINSLRDLEYILGNFRKLLRFGRCIDNLYAAMNLIQNDDALVSVNVAVSKVSFALYLLCDHIIWLGRCGFAEVDTNWWGRVACRYWLFSIVVNLIRDYVEIKRLLSQSKFSYKLHCSDTKLLLKYWLLFAEEHKDVVLDIVKNGCDIFLPLVALNYINLSPSTVGLLGVISSFVGIYSLFDPYAKLPLS